MINAYNYWGNFMIRCKMYGEPVIVANCLKKLMSTIVKKWWQNQSNVKYPNQFHLNVFK